MRTINADELQSAIFNLPFSDWTKDELKALIDNMSTVGGQSKILYRCLIPLNPKTKKNNQQIIYNKKERHSMIVQSDVYKQYEKDAGWFLKTLERPINCPVNIKCIFYRDSERRCDLTNLLEAIDDILVKYKIITDDNFKIIYSHDGSRVFVDRANPRTEIEITEIINYTTQNGTNEANNRT